MSYISFQELSYAERKKFENYLDSSGVTDALGNALYCLSSERERPENPKEYIVKEIAAYSGDTPDFLKELKETREKLTKLKKENKQLRERVAKKFSMEAAQQKRKTEASSKNHESERNQDV